jgi:hypothetical protein
MSAGACGRRAAGVVRRAVLAVALVPVFLVLGVAPAAADPPGPTDYESGIVALEPRTSVVAASIIGGDAFLLLEVTPGHEVLVMGYRGEPFVRFAATGEVAENRSSPSWYESQERYGTLELPPEATPEAEPRWVTVADDGRWMWHDHRVHWMGTVPPLGSVPGDVVLDTVVPLRVDGEPVSLRVRSVLQAPPSPVPALLGAGIGLALVLGAARLAGAHRGTALALSAVASAALIVGIRQVRSVPPETGPSALHWLLAAAALVPALVAVVAWRRPRAGGGILVPALVALAGAELALWGWYRREGLSRAILPTDVPFAFDRFVTAAAIAAGLVGLGVALWSLLGSPAPGTAGVKRPGRRVARAGSP